MDDKDSNKSKAVVVASAATPLHPRKLPGGLAVLALSATDIPSLRRELESKEKRLIQVHDVNEDLSAKSRTELEQEIRELRAQVNSTVSHIVGYHSELRDVMSHVVTGKDTEALHINKTSPTEQAELRDILRNAGRRALGGGLPGAAAMAIQVSSLMWLRTTMNYQYRHGTTTREALRALYKDGGVVRFYRGYGPALLQGPLSRFGDTAANAGVLALLNSYDSTRDLPIAMKTVTASAAAALWRISLMPIDTTKTIMQVEGVNGFPNLAKKVKASGPKVLYHGALAAAGATFVGHFPWFFTFNTLNAWLPEAHSLTTKLIRNASMGFCASFISDLTSNSIRVTKVTKQTNPVPITYPEAVKQVIAADGIKGLFFRGLGTRILANGLQGMMFTVLWKGIEEHFRNEQKEKSKMEV